MQGERGLTTTEMVGALALAAVLFLVGLWVGGAFDSNDSSSGGDASGLSANGTSPPNTGEPTAEELAALILAEADGAEGGDGGASATAALLEETVAQRQQAAQRAAYWASVGATMSSLQGLAVRMSVLQSAEQVKRERALLRRLQAHSLFALARLRQVQATERRRKAALHLVNGGERALDESVARAEEALGAAGGEAAEEAANELSSLGESLSGALFEAHTNYVRAIEAAEDGEMDEARQLLDDLESELAEFEAEAAR